MGQMLEIIFMDVDGLFQYNAHPMNVEVRTLTNVHEVELLGRVETNVNWMNMPAEYRLWQRSLRWWEASHIVADHSMNDGTQWTTMERIHVYQH